MASRRKKRVSARRAAAVVEFAICAPVVFLIFIGMIEFGRIMMVQHVVTTSAREGGRECILINASQSSVEDVIEEGLATIGVDDDEYSLTISPAVGSASSGDTVTLTVSVPITSVTAFGSMWFGSDYQLSSTVAMRKEGFE